MERTELRKRTIERGEAVWQDYDVLGLTEGTARVEDQINQLGRDTIRQGIAIVDGAAAFEGAQRDKLHELQLVEVEQDVWLAREKHLAQQQILAMKIAGEKALLAAREYDIQVQAFIVTAKEFAARIEREQIALQKSRALMDIKKEEAHLTRTGSEILLEFVNQQNVQVDIAKAKVEAAKAAVRAVTTEVEAKQAELRVVQAELEIIMAEVEAATLTADIAHIYADIIIRGLAKIKLAVETAEIEAGFTFIQSKLDDMLAIWADRRTMEEIRADYERLFLDEALKQLPLQKQVEDLRLEQQNREIEVFYFEKDKLDGGSGLIQQMRPGGISDEDWNAITAALSNRNYTGSGISIAQCEKMKKDAQELKRENLAQIKYWGERFIRNMTAYVEVLISAAHASVASNSVIQEFEKRIFSQKIHKGFFAMGGGCGVSFDDEDNDAPSDGNIPDQDVTVPEC